MRGRQLRMSKQDKQYLKLKVYESKQAVLQGRINRIIAQMEASNAQA